MILPELLAPAGQLSTLFTALHFGADAVYGAMKSFGLRAFAGNFSEDDIHKAVAACHQKGKRFYLTMNIFPYDDELSAFIEAAQFAYTAGVDAIIASDLGAISVLRSHVPQMPIHVSTQASTVNSAAVRVYQEMGCRRIILAREMTLERIKAMERNFASSIELETFVHGASCVAYSGRCLLSAALTGRSGNRGTCAQPCRWRYSVMEEKRPGEYLPVAEDERGTYVFSAKDLNLMPLLPELIKAGVSSFKIEGRMKTEYYVAVVTGAYRRALDLLASDGEHAFRSQLPDLMNELACASHRESDTGFMLGAPEKPAGADCFHQTREYIARALSDSKQGEDARFELKNRFFSGDTLELMTPYGITSFIAPAFMREKNGETVDTLGIAGEIIRMRLPCDVRAGDMLRGKVRNHQI